MLSTGVDIVAIARIEHLLAHFGERFLSRVYTPEEIRYSRSILIRAGSALCRQGSRLQSLRGRHGHALARRDRVARSRGP